MYIKKQLSGSFHSFRFIPSDSGVHKNETLFHITYVGWYIVGTIRATVKRIFFLEVSHWKMKKKPAKIIAGD